LIRFVIYFGLFKYIWCVGPTTLVHGDSMHTVIVTHAYTHEQLQTV